MGSVFPVYLLFILLTTSFASYTFTFSNVFGDGLFMEELAGSFGDRQANLLIKMSPPVVTTELIQKLIRPSKKSPTLLRLKRMGNNCWPIGFTIQTEIC